MSQGQGAPTRKEGQRTLAAVRLLRTRHSAGCRALAQIKAREAGVVLIRRHSPACLRSPRKEASGEGKPRLHDADTGGRKAPTVYATTWATGTLALMTTPRAKGSDAMR